MKTPDENTQLALEWLQEHIPDVVKDGILDDWLEWHEEDYYLPEDDCRAIGDRTIELIDNIPKYVEIVKLLNDNNQESLSRACELAEELK